VPIKWTYTGGSVKGLKGAAFDVVFEGDRWDDYDEEAETSVSVSEVKSQFELVKAAAVKGGKKKK
jgi:hypothetical protein